MPRRKADIDLSSGLDKVLNFNDPRLTDAQFEKALVDAFYVSIVTSWTCGTDDPKAYDRAQAAAERRVNDAIRRNGLADRDQLISAVFESASTRSKSPPAPPAAPDPKTPPKFAL